MEARRGNAIPARRLHRLPGVDAGGGVERIFGGAEELAGGEDAQLVLLVAVGEEGEAPLVGPAEVTEAAEVGGSVPKPLQVLLPALMPVRRRPAGAKDRLGVSVHVTELAP